MTADLGVGRGRRCSGGKHNESAKNHPGGVGDMGSFEKEGRLYQTTDDPSDGFNALQSYNSKLNPECTAFFQFPKRLDYSLSISMRDS